MKRKTNRSKQRWKAAGITLLAVMSGIALLIFSQAVKPDPATAEHAPSDHAPSDHAPSDHARTDHATAATAPAEPIPSAPLQKPVVPPVAPTPGDPEATAQNMSGLALLFSMMCFLVAVVIVGWIGYDIYQSRPAWKKQTRYPVRK